MKELRHERKTLVGRYYLLPSEHAATGDYLYNEIHKTNVGGAAAMRVCGLEASDQTLVEKHRRVETREGAQGNFNA